MATRVTRKLTSKRFLASGIAIALAAVLLAGLAGPASAAVLAARPAKVKIACATALAAGSKLDTALNTLVSKGTITSQQEQAIKDELASEAGPRLKACEGLEILKESKVGPAVLQLLGMNRAAVVQQWKAGKSLAEMAQAKGVDRQKLIDTITTSIGNELDTLVQNGKITADKKTEVMNTLDAKIGQIVDAHKGEAKTKTTVNSTPVASPAAGATPTSGV